MSEIILHRCGVQFYRKIFANRKCMFSLTEAIDDFERNSQIC